ncbi:1,3-beta-glucanosyltransferase [Homalodisca vitripennis]|nr:1,3-beta-glucanosyltransferase [Homalodisca vitripennis]
MSHCISFSCSGGLPLDVNDTTVRRHPPSRKRSEFPSSGCKFLLMRRSCVWRVQNLEHLTSSNFPGVLKNGLEHLTSSNLLDMLDNGAVLCRLARVIQERALEAVRSGLATGTPPVIKGRCFENAARRSFFSRDNMDKFIQFCRQLGVHQNLLFESDDLVLQNNPRSVILCLMEVARIASRFNMEPPGLVALEKEIAEEESHDSGLSHGSIVSWQFQPTPSPHSKVIRHSSSASALSGWNKTIVDRRSLVLEGEVGPPPPLPPPQPPGGGASDGVPSDTTEDDWSRGSGEDPDLEIEPTNTPTQRGITDLDRKVQHVTRAAQKHCRCSDGKCEKLKVKKVGEGKYNIAGRNVFVRLGRCAIDYCAHRRPAMCLAIML